MKNIKIKGLDESNLDELNIQKLTRIENGKQTIGKNSSYESRQKGGLTNVATGHISSLGKEWGQWLGKTYGKENGRKVGSSGLGAKAMKEKTSAPIIQMNMDGKKIKEWNSINDAKNSKYKFHAGHISECCNGLKPQYRGFLWKFK